MKQRFETLDTFRGIVIINMIAYHFLYDVFVIFGGDSMWYRHPGIHAWQQFICCSFIILSGFVWPYGKQKNLKRGILINILGFVITAFTLIVTPDEVIWFGILNFLGCAILLMLLMDLLFTKLSKPQEDFQILHPEHVYKPSGGSASQTFVPGHLYRQLETRQSYRRFCWLGLIISLALFLLLRRITTGVFGFYPLGIVDLTFGHIPDAFYQCKALIPLGLPTADFFSSDYFPILPWFCLYVFGYFLGRILERQQWFMKLSHAKLPVINWMGRKSIWIYMMHQVICYGICLLIFT